MTRSLNNQGTATDVLIAGKVYSLKGADQEHLQKVAAFLNRKIVEVRNIQGYKKLDPEYKELLMDLNLADEYFKVSDELAKLKEEMDAKENELYAARHELVSLKLKLENALRQQNVLEKRSEEWKNRYEELKGDGFRENGQESEEEDIQEN